MAWGYDELEHHLDASKKAHANNQTCTTQHVLNAYAYKHLQEYIMMCFCDNTEDS